MERGLLHGGHGEITHPQFENWFAPSPPVLAGIQRSQSNISCSYSQVDKVAFDVVALMTSVFFAGMGFVCQHIKNAANPQELWITM
jgi:hypothetical protein